MDAIFKALADDTRRLILDVLREQDGQTLQDLESSLAGQGVEMTRFGVMKHLDVLRDAIDGDFPEPWRYFDIATVNIAGEPVTITRTGFSNEVGWEFYLRPENNAENIGNRIWEAGQKHGMILTATPVFRARRIEAGLMSQAEFDSTTTPFDAGLGHFVQMEKPDFIGKSALETADKRSRTFGMRVRSGIAERGRTITIGGNVVGLVCSSTWSPYQECGVALVRMDDPEMGPNTEVDVTGIDGKVYSAQLCSLPMYDAEGAFVRGKNTTIPEGPEPWNG